MRNLTTYLWFHIFIRLTRQISGEVRVRCLQQFPKYWRNKVNKQIFFLSYRSYFSWLCITSMWNCFRWFSLNVRNSSTNLDVWPLSRERHNQLWKQCFIQVFFLNSLKKLSICRKRAKITSAWRAMKNQPCWRIQCLPKSEPLWMVNWRYVQSVTSQKHSICFPALSLSCGIRSDCIMPQVNSSPAAV